MKFALTILAIVTLPGCSQDSARLPTAPAPASAFVWAMVVDETGGCIDGATLQVVRGQGVGQTLAQSLPCAIYDYGGGALFEDLTPGVAMTVRASAPGYADLEKTLIPISGLQPAALFWPARIQ